MRRLAAWTLTSMVLAGAAGCGTTSLTPVAYPEPEVGCPAGRVSWRLEIADQRAERRDSERLTSLIRESLSRSFPACRWETEGSAPLIRIEVHRFTADLQGNVWDAAAEWAVTAQGSGGETLTEFRAEADISRPNYRGSNNELEALRQAFDQVLRRTLTGLRNLSLTG